MAVGIVEGVAGLVAAASVAVAFAAGAVVFDAEVVVAVAVAVVPFLGLLQRPSRLHTRRGFVVVCISKVRYGMKGVCEGKLRGKTHESPILNEDLRMDQK